MATIDWVIIILLALGAVSGFMKGFFKQLAAVVGLIAAAALLLVTPESFGENCADWRSWIIFIAAFAATKWLKMHPILMICVAAVVGIIIY